MLLCRVQCHRCDQLTGTDTIMHNLTLEIWSMKLKILAWIRLYSAHQRHLEYLGLSSKVALCVHKEGQNWNAGVHANGGYYISNPHTVAL